MQIGTAHFYSKQAAILYYKRFSDYSHDAAVEAVERKIKDREIFIGEPPLKQGERLELIDSGTRYAIVF